MPFLAPLIPAAIGAAGAIVGNAISSSNTSDEQKRQAQQAQQAGQAAQQNAQNALQSPQVQAAQAAAQQQAAFAQAAGAVNGLGNQQNSYNNLGGLAGQYGQIAAGQGPNPAQAMLAQQTGANIASQAALQAGQRGAGANAGLIARNAGQQGGNLQQQAVGQGATLQANQSLAALGQEGNIYGQQANIAGQQVGQQQNALSASTNAAQNNQNAALNTLGQANAIQGQLANTNLGGSINQNSQNTQNNQQLISGAFQGAGQGIAALAKKAEGGMIEKYAEGGPVSMLGQHFHKMKMAKGGKVPALVSPGEKIIPRKEVAKVAAGNKAPMEAGKTVPGKANVKGAKNSYANDTVPKTLNEGDIVLPRSVTQSKNPHWAAHQFVSKIMSEKGLPTRKVK